MANSNNDSQAKLVVVSAPSGCGKTTIINAILEAGRLPVTFSVSATNRQPRPGEKDGVNYYYLTTEQFMDAVSQNQFVEYEEVYPGRFYGTPVSEIERVARLGKTLLLDIDVKGALNVKKMFGDRALIIFIMPPSTAVLYDRLNARATESQEVIAERFAKAEYELTFAPQFDVRIVNDDLAQAIAETEAVIAEFISTPAQQ